MISALEEIAKRLIKGYKIKDKAKAQLISNGMDNVLGKYLDMYKELPQIVKEDKEIIERMFRIGVKKTHKGNEIVMQTFYDK